MVRRIEKDHQRFRQIVRGKIRENLRRYVTHGEMIGRKGKDAVSEKATYPALIGLDAAREMATRLISEALDSIATMGPAADPLRWLARYIISRER